MSEFWTVLWYTLKGSNVFPFRGRRGGIFPVLFSVVFFTLVFGLPIYAINYESTRFLSTYGIEEIVDLNIGFWSFSISILSLTSFVPFLMYNLSRNEETGILYTFPISRFQIALLFSITSLISNTMMPVAYVFGLMGYASATSRSLLLAFVLSSLNVLFIVFVSLLIALLFSKSAKANLRRLNLYIFLFDLIVLVLMIQMTPATLGGKRFTEIFQKLRIMKNILNSPWNPFYWPVLGLENSIFIVPIFSSVLMAFAGVRLASRKMDFSPLKLSSWSLRGTGFGVFGKDLKIAGRKEQFFFFLVYPVVFSVLYGFFTGDPSVMISINCVFSVFYSSVMGAALMQSEYESNPLFKTFPVHWTRILFPKIIIPVLMYVPVSSAVILSSMMMGFEFLKALGVISFMVLAYTFSSLAGVREFLKSPTIGRVVLPITSVLKVEAWSVGLVFVGLVYRLTYERSKLLYFKILGTRIAMFMSEYGTVISVILAITFMSVWSFEIAKEMKRSD